MASAVVKACHQCGVLKPLSEFHKNRGCKDGHRGTCRSCTNARLKAYFSISSNRARRNKIANRCNKSRRQNPELRAKMNASVSNWRLSLREEVLKRYGYKCACCGISEREFLALDHKYGGGNQERKRLGILAGPPTYYKAKQENFPDKYRLLCHNCNQSRGSYGYCPHEKEKRA